MYKENFVASIRVVNSRQILREKDGVVQLPFGSEYSIYMKNTNSQRAVVTIVIDGQPIGGDLVINAHDSLELERFVKGDMSKGRRFRFIEKTEQISEHRGDRIEDGLIEVRYRFEKPAPEIRIRETIIDHIHHHYPDPYTPNPWPGSVCKKGGTDAKQPWESNISFGSGSSDCSRGVNFGAHMNASSSTTLSMFNIAPSPVGEEGITVEGSDSNQQFQHVSVGTLETQEHVITIKLLGVNPSSQFKISRPVTVKMACPTCGHLTKGKYCENCGTRIRD